MAFDLNIGRKVILNPAPPGAGKTSSIVQLALALQEYDKKLVVIDRDRGFAEALVTFSNSEMPENIEYHFIRTWDDVEIAVNDALDNLGKDAPFSLRKDHVECLDHGFHEYWIVETLPDRNYLFREDFSDLAKTLLESDGPIWREPHPN